MRSRRIKTIAKKGELSSIQPLIIPNENWRLLLGASTARLTENSLHFFGMTFLSFFKNPKTKSPLTGKHKMITQSFDFSSGLFSFGLTVERTTMNLFSKSNQNGEP